MKQLRMFDKQATIPGLGYLPQYITPEQEEELIQAIDNMPWSTELRRRVQHYGYKYDYKSRSIGDSHYLGPIPYWLKDISTRLYKDNIFTTEPDQIIINEYISGQGIASHVDCIQCFGDVICSLSLGSSCMMTFTNDLTKQSVLLAPRSLLILQDDARYTWKHSIPARKSDNGLPRRRRVSLTFRKLNLIL